MSQPIRGLGDHICSQTPPPPQKKKKKKTKTKPKQNTHTNLVKGVYYLLPVKFHQNLSSSFCEGSQKYEVYNNGVGRSTEQKEYTPIFCNFWWSQ